MPAGSGGNQESQRDRANGPTDAEVVETAAAAAESVIFSRLDRSDVEDFDVSVTFDDGVLEVDVYVNASTSTDEERVAEDAALAARAAVDELF